uniref:Uncharacterized protein n=1 Tax=Gossypium raimondii TaxID=29730 RepID=A0A0D2QZJ4_GOSRA|nr:hypothetical protein B456_002G024100 [Gossypium raimondii]
MVLFRSKIIRMKMIEGRLSLLGSCSISRRRNILEKLFSLSIIPLDMWECCLHLMLPIICVSMSGLPIGKNVVVDQALGPGKRVTVAMGTNQNLDYDLPRQVVSPSKPREDTGTYWGYKVRYASNISSVFSDCPYKGGYDHLIGTSEHGIVVKSSQLNLPAFRHLLIAFGGLLGLEKSVEEDNKLKGKNVRDIFNMYLNTCPHQGSRTIRTEEALLISLQYFQEPITRAMQGPVS